MSAAERSGYFTRPSKASVAFAEEKAWIGFYNRIADSAVAEEVIQYLDANPDEKHQHPALYLRAKRIGAQKRAATPPCAAYRKFR